MKVYLYIKHKPHPQAITSQGLKEGDISSVHPIDEIPGTLTLRTYIPILIDINIPCGQGQVTGMDFAIGTDGNPKWKCVECPFNDIVNCDVINYRSAEWGAGDIENAPKIVRNRRHKVDYKSFLSVDSLALIKKQDKNDAEKALVFTNAGKNEQLKTIIEEKV